MVERKDSRVYLESKVGRRTPPLEDAVDLLVDVDMEDELGRESSGLVARAEAEAVPVAGLVDWRITAKVMAKANWRVISCREAMDSLHKQGHIVVPNLQ